MKTSIKTILAATLILGLGSCTKKLDTHPYNQIDLGSGFQSVKDASTWNNGLYADFRGRLYGTYLIPQEVQADYLNASLDYGNRNGNPHRWGSSFLADDGVLSGTWAGYYSALKNINQCIDNFDKIPATTSADQASMARYKGDAYLARAYYYSELMVRFAKPYEPSTAATDLGVPLVLHYDLNELPSRATSKAVYDQILSDITTAKGLLSNIAGAQGSIRFTKDVVSALEARVRLNIQDWAGAIAAADAVINTGLYPLITTTTEMSSMWTNDFAKEVIMMPAVVKTSEPPAVNNIFLGFIASTGKYDPDFIPTTTIINLYPASDIRKPVYFKTVTATIQGTDFTLTLVNKYPGNPTLFTTTTTNYQNAPKPFRVAEMYAISAEAGSKLGGAAEAAALVRLNQLRVARGEAAVAATGAALVQEVRDERTRELAFEGFRLWDLKRWHLGFTRSGAQNTNTIQVGPAYNTLTIAADDPKFVWGVPTNDFNVNKNLIQNAGW